MDEGTNPSATNAVRAIFKVGQNGVDIERLNAAADAVEALMATQGWGLLVAMLQDERERTLAVLDRADPPGRSMFARAHGFARGVLVVRDYAQAVIQYRATVMDRQRAKHEGQAAMAGTTEA